MVKTECEDPGEYVGGAIEFWDLAMDVLARLPNYSDSDVSTSPHDRAR